MDTLIYTGELTRMTCWCGICHAVPTDLANYQRRKHDDGKEVPGIYCPLGHTHVPAGRGKAAILESRLQYEKEERARVTAEREQAEASARAHKGAATKARKKAAAAVCPVPRLRALVRAAAAAHEIQAPRLRPRGMTGTQKILVAVIGGVASFLLFTAAIVTSNMPLATKLVLEGILVLIYAMWTLVSQI